jgi:predicted GNAT family acetyltransferase
MSGNDVIDNKDKSRFELTVDGHVAVADYKEKPGLVVITHTGVPSALGGRGVGTTLIKGALDMIRASGRKVVPQCPFVSAVAEKNPEYRDLLA